MILRFLVVEGNTIASRARQRADFGRTAGENYAEVLRMAAGGGVCDILCAADADAALPAGVALADYDGIAITGSALHVWQGAPESVRQVDLARAIFAARVPFFGSCWGLQVAAVAAGGVVRQNPKGREIGFARAIRANAEGAAHPMLAGRPPGFAAPCVHLDEVQTLPEGARILASNAISDVQAAEIPFAGGMFWGVQYHPEYSLATVATTLRRHADTLIAEGFVADAAVLAALTADLDALHADGERADIAWRYGLGPELTDPRMRITEIVNWVEHRVRPHAARRQSAA